MLPLIPFIGTFCEYSLAYLWMWHVKRRTVFGIQLSIFVEDSAQLRALAIRRLALSFPFLIIVRDLPLFRDRLEPTEAGAAGIQRSVCEVLRNI